MKFTDMNMEKIRAGQKTQTRRPMKAYEKLWFALEKNMIDRSNPYKRLSSWKSRVFTIPTVVSLLAGEGRLPRIKWQVGRTYAAVPPGRGMLGVTHIRLLSIREELLLVITEDDARAEGFRNCSDFFVFWDNLYKKRPELQHEKNPTVWVLGFELLVDVV